MEDETCVEVGDLVYVNFLKYTPKPGQNQFRILWAEIKIKIEPQEIVVKPTL